MSSPRTRDPRLVAVINDRYVSSPTSAVESDDRVETKDNEINIETKNNDAATWIPTTRFNAQNIASASPVLPEPTVIIETI